MHATVTSNETATGPSEPLISTAEEMNTAVSNTEFEWTDFFNIGQVKILRKIETQPQPTGVIA